MRKLDYELEGKVTIDQKGIAKIFTGKPDEVSGSILNFLKETFPDAPSNEFDGLMDKVYGQVDKLIAEAKKIIAEEEKTGRMTVFSVYKDSGEIRKKYPDLNIVNYKVDSMATSEVVTVSGAVILATFGAGVLLGVAIGVTLTLVVYELAT